MSNSKSTTDAELLRQLQSNEQQALLSLMKRYDKKLFRYLYSKTRSAEASEEFVQDIFLSAWHNRFNLSITDSFYPYLFKAAKFKVVDYYIANSRQVANLDELLVNYELITASSPENAVIETELNNWLAQEIEKMPDNVRKSFSLSRVEQLPVKEIAAKLSLSEQTVKNNITMAVKQLHFRFKKIENLFLFSLATYLLF